MSSRAFQSEPNTFRSDLNSILGDGAAFSLMVGMGETYVPAFALALGLGDVAVGLIATVPLLAGGVLQLISPWAVRRMGSRRRWVVTCAITQAISLLLLVGMALVYRLPPWLVFLPATLYWAAGLATGPAWNAWVEQLVPRSLRATFFALRVRISHVCVLVGLVVGGLILRGGAGERPVAIFAVLFGIAAVSRLISAVMLTRQSEPADEGFIKRDDMHLAEAADRVGHGSGRRLVVYLLAVQVSVYIAAPYFTPYMLGQLQLSYFDYMLLLGCGYLGKIVALPWAGRFAKRLGASSLLWLGGISIIPLSALWLVSNSFAYLILLQIAGGVAWAWFELATFLLFFETIPRSERIGMLTLYNFGNAAAMVIGGLLGAVVLELAGYGPMAYLAVFGLSSLARAVALFAAPRAPVSPQEVIMPSARTLAVRPMAGSIDRPILPAMNGDPVALTEPTYL